MIKPSSHRVIEIAEMATRAILHDIAEAEGLVSPPVLIQLKIEQVITTLLQAFEKEIAKCSAQSSNRA